MFVYGVQIEISALEMRLECDLLKKIATTCLNVKQLTNFVLLWTMERRTRPV